MATSVALCSFYNAFCWEKEDAIYIANQWYGNRKATNFCVRFIYANYASQAQVA